MAQVVIWWEHFPNFLSLCSCVILEVGLDFSIINSWSCLTFKIVQFDDSEIVFDLLHTFIQSPLLGVDRFRNAQWANVFVSRHASLSNMIPVRRWMLGEVLRVLSHFMHGDGADAYSYADSQHPDEDGGAPSSLVNDSSGIFLSPLSSSFFSVRGLMMTLTISEQKSSCFSEWGWKGLSWLFQMRPVVVLLNTLNDFNRRVFFLKVAWRQSSGKPFLLESTWVHELSSTSDHASSIKTNNRVSVAPIINMQLSTVLGLKGSGLRADRTSWWSLFLTKVGFITSSSLSCWLWFSSVSYSCAFAPRQLAQSFASDALLVEDCKHLFRLSLSNFAFLGLSSSWFAFLNFLLRYC